MMKINSLSKVLVFVFVSIALCSCGNNDEGTSLTAHDIALTDSEWVDLGLPSGLLWASCNVGETRPEDYGDYYAWGETAVKDVYDWQTYIHCNGAPSRLTKYCNQAALGFDEYTDDLTILQTVDDAASVNIGGGARIPSSSEWRELMAGTISVWTTVNNVYGRKIIGDNGNAIFLPAAGGYWGSALCGDGKYGYYWADGIDLDNPRYAWYFCFDYSLTDNGSIGRDHGFPVRAVRGKK